MNEQAQELYKYLEKSHWKQFLISAIYFNPECTIYQKELMRNKNAGTRFSFNKYIKELTQWGVLEKTYDGQQVVLQITPNWQPVLKTIHENYG
jgi:hypothetical protein